MKCEMSLVLLAGLFLGIARAASPVSRVAQLLQDLSEKIDSELETETKLYDDYVCWAQTVVKSKTASNEAAQTRVDSLKTYLADLEAGRIEVTTERSDLEKEVNTLLSNVETATALRKQQNTDFKAATAEMDQAITALKAGIKVLGDATKGSKSSLVSLRASISQTAAEGNSEGFGVRVAEADQLQRAIDVGTKWLKPGDAMFLQRLLSGEVPNVDWKKLNRKAGFKMKYKARSVKIQDTLAKLLQTFEDNKKDAVKKEKDAKDEYDTLSKAKKAQLKASQEALRKQEVEGGAAGVSKADAKAEVDALETQIKDDEKYIGETETALKKKKGEFAARRDLRVGEMKAISEARAYIHSDEARDLFKKSIPSFLQVDDVVATATARATATLQETAHATGNLRLSALAARIGLTSGAKFDKVLSAITKMVDELKQDQKDDDSDKTDCETDREADTKEAASHSRAIDELSDDISKLEGEIKEIKAEIEEKEASVKEKQGEIKEAKRIRKDENTEWKQADADDAAAIELVQKSAGVLKKFYNEAFDKSQSLLQKNSARDAPDVEAGEAPPPPPATWDGAYGGAQKEQTGIVSIMKLIEDDMKKDKASAKTNEDDAQTEHDKYLKETNAAIKALNTAINGLEDSKGNKEKSIKAKEKTSNNKKGSLDAVVKKMKKAAPGCDFLLVNFKTRKANRDLEISGLSKAKDILKAQNKGDIN